ncbi:MAG: hypothetical protein AAFV25_27720, partial [Bacteroidota bacterium]
HSQLEAYAELVATLSKGLTTYVNETKNDIEISEVLEFLSTLPLHQANLLKEGETFAYDTTQSATEPLEIEQEDQNNQGNITSIVELAKNILKPDPSTFPSQGIIGNVVKGITKIFAEPKETISYADGDMPNPYAKFEAAVNSNDNAEMQEQFLDIVRTTMSFNKYGLLENMVETGLIRLIVDRGLIQTEFFMELKERSSEFTANSFKHKVKTKEKRRRINKRGLFHLFKRKRKVVSKDKTLTLSKSRNSTSNSTSGTAQMKAKVEIHFSTDYKPLLLDQS